MKGSKTRHKENYCRHYEVPNPLQYVCAAGALDLDSLSPGGLRALPCVLSLQGPKQDTAVCPYFEPYTEAEIRAWEDETERAVANVQARIARGEVFGCRRGFDGGQA